MFDKNKIFEYTSELEGNKKDKVKFESKYLDPNVEIITE